MKKINKSLLILGTTILLSASLLQTQVTHAYTIEASGVTTTKAFKDVPKTHPYYNIINEMAQKGIISGYEDGTFKPNEYITRQHAAVLINRVVENLESYDMHGGSFNYADIDKAHPYYKEINTLVEADMLEPFMGKVSPQKVLTRSEMARILAIAFGLKATKESPFMDIKDSDDEEYINALYANGVTTGYEDGTFRPKEPVTRKHYAVFIYNAMKAKEHMENNAQGIDLSPDMSIEDFNKSLVENNLFHPRIVNANPNFWGKSYYLRKTLTEGQKLLEGTEYKFIEADIQARIAVKDTTYVLIYDAPEYRELSIRFRPQYDGATELVKQFLKLLYPEFDLSNIIDEKIEDFEEELSKGRSFISNKSNYVFGDLLVDAGMREDNWANEYNFDIKIEKLNEQEKLQLEIMKNQNHNVRNNVFFLNDNDSNISYYAQEFGISYDNLKQIIYEVKESGEVYNGGNFSIYYDTTNNNDGSFIVTSYYKLATSIYFME